MSIGRVPRYSVFFPIEGLTNQQFLFLIDEAARKLNWEVSNITVNGFVAYTKFRKGSLNEKITLNIEGNLVTMKSESMGGQFIDWGRNRRNIDELLSNYEDLRASVTPEEMKIKTESFTQNQLTDQEVNQQDSIEAPGEEKGVFSVLVPTKGYYVTPIIIDLNILVFILMCLSGAGVMLPDNESLLKWGANFRPLTLEGQPWRLLTNCFLHIGILHLLFNMYALLYIGVLLERRLGSWRFGICYLVTGILASITSLYWHPMTISAGASGAIFGMYGVFLAMLTTNLIDKTQRKTLLISIAVFVGYNLLNGMKGGIDNAAHIGGLLSGIILGYSFYPGLTNAENRKLNFGLPALLIVALFAFSSWEYRRIPNDIAKYDERMKSFFSMESQALEIFNMPASTSKDKLLAEISDRSLYYWKEDKNLVIELDKLDLPSVIHARNKQLILYCDLRIASCGLIYKSIDEGTDKYNDQIKEYVNRINLLVKSLK